MKDYQKLLDKFPNGFLSFFTGKKYMGIPDEVINYLNNYWLSKLALDKTWSGIKYSIFIGDFRTFPNKVFREDFDIIILRGGNLFDREDFNQFSSCITKTGDNYFVIIEDYDENNPPGNLPPSPGLIDWPPLRFKYPVGITFDELMRGEFVSEELILMSSRYYYIFGDSGQWGIYAGNDAEAPLHIIGFKHQFSELFNSHFIVSDEEKQILKSWFEKDMEEQKRLFGGSSKTVAPKNNKLG